MIMEVLAVRLSRTARMRQHRVALLGKGIVPKDRALPWHIWTALESRFTDVGVSKHLIVARKVQGLAAPSGDDARCPQAAAG